MFKSWVKNLLGTRYSRLLVRLIRGGNLHEVHIVEGAFKSLGTIGVMIDVGAHHGSSLDGFAEAGWTVYAFEPDPKNRAYLTSLVGHRPNVHIDIRGVSDAPKKDVPFFTSEVSTGISSLSSFHVSHREALRIDLVTLSQFAEEKHISRVDFLKIDTEGFDIFVLKGFPWERFTPQCVVCEYENRKTEALGYNTDDMYNFLIARGYEVAISEWCPVVEYGGSVTWKAFRRSPAEIDPDSWGNLIAYRPGSPLAKLLNCDALTAKYARNYTNLRNS